MFRNLTATHWRAVGLKGLNLISVFYVRRDAVAEEDVVVVQFVKNVGTIIVGNIKQLVSRCD